MDSNQDMSEDEVWGAMQRSAGFDPKVLGEDADDDEMDDEAFAAAMREAAGDSDSVSDDQGDTEQLSDDDLAGLEEDGETVSAGELSVSGDEQVDSHDEVDQVDSQDEVDQVDSQDEDDQVDSQNEEVDDLDMEAWAQQEITSDNEDAAFGSMFADELDESDLEEEDEKEKKPKLKGKKAKMAQRMKELARAHGYGGDLNIDSLNTFASADDFEKLIQLDSQVVDNKSKSSAGTKRKSKSNAQSAKRFKK